MLRFFLLCLFIVHSLNFKNDFQDSYTKENLVNNICQESLFFISSKIVRFENVSKIHYIDTCFNKIPQSKPVNGGALHIIESTNVLLKSCTFSNNIYAGNGGAIYFESSLFKIYLCTFYNNQAFNSGGAIMFSNLYIKNPECSIMSTIFLNNIANFKGGGIFLMHYSPIDLNNVTFESNEASTGASLCFISKNDQENSSSIVKIQRCNFIVNTSASNIHIKTNIDINNFQVIIFKECFFRSDINFDTDKKQFFHLFAQQTNISFRSNNYADGPNTTFYTTDCNFTDFVFNYNFNLVQAVSKDIRIPVIKEIIVTNRQQYIEIPKNVRIINTNFSSFTSQENGGAVYLAHCPRTSIKSVIFSSTKTRQKGGAIYSNQSQIEIFDTSFLKCVSYDEGGAIFIDVQSGYLRYFNIMNCIFDSNEAQFNGGAISIKNSLNLLIAKCTFKMNYADLNGLSIYSYGVNDFVFFLVSSYFYSVDYSSSFESQIEMNNFYSKAEIDLNSFQILAAQSSFFIPTPSLPLSQFFESNPITTESNDRNLSEKILLKGKDVILSLTVSQCCINASGKSSVQMNVFDPYGYLHFNCTNHTKQDSQNHISDRSKNSTESEKKKFNDDDDDDDDKKITGIVQLPIRNVFMSEIDDDKISIFNKTVNDYYELKKFANCATVLPLSSSIVDLMLDANEDKDFYDSFFISPLCNDSQIVIQNDGELKEHSKKAIGIHLQNVSSEVTLNQASPSISVKGIGNLSFTSQSDSENLTLNCITSYRPYPLKLNFSEKFDCISVEKIDFFIRGSLMLESTKNLVSVKNVVVHQESVSKVNSLKLTENMTFKLNSKLEVTDEIKFGERSIIVFEFNESAKIGHFFHHKEDVIDLKKRLRPILTIPSFSSKTSGIPMQIVVKNGSVATSFVLKPSTEYYSVSSHFSQMTSSHLNHITSKEVPQHHSLLISKLSSSSSLLSASLLNENNDVDVDDVDGDGKFEYKEKFDGNVSSLNVITLLCSNDFDFDFDFCSSLISSTERKDDSNFESNFIVIENEFLVCECFVNERNQTCIGLFDRSNRNDIIRYVHLSASGLVGVIFGSIAAIAALIAVIFVANGNYTVKYKGVGL